MNERIDKSRLKSAAEKAEYAKAEDLSVKYDEVMRDLEGGLLAGEVVVDAKAHLDELASNIVEEADLIGDVSIDTTEIQNRIGDLDRELDNVKEIFPKLEASFEEIEAVFEGTGVKIDLAALTSSYNNLDSLLKVPHREIVGDFNKVLKGHGQDEVKKYADELKAALHFYVNGNFAKGRDILDDLDVRLNLLPFARDAHERLGFDSNFSPESLMLVLDAARNNGVNIDTSLLTIESLLPHVSGDFASLGLDSEGLANFLLNTILTHKELGDNSETFEGLRFEVMSKTEAKIAEHSAKLDEHFKTVQMWEEHLILYREKEMHRGRKVEE